jgi:cytochrome c oxidase subunit IV
MGGILSARIWALVQPKLRASAWAVSRDSDWRISTANSLLLAIYLMPAWLNAALHIYRNPARGLFDQANIASTTFAADYLHLEPEGLMRFALIVALAKMTVVLFFACFMSLSIIGDKEHRQDRDELLYIGLTLAAVISVASMLLAYFFGSAEALRLHATETLMIVAGCVVAIIDEPRQPADIDVSAETAELLVPHTSDWSAAA